MKRIGMAAVLATGVGADLWWHGMADQAPVGAVIAAAPVPPAMLARAQSLADAWAAKVCPAPR